MKLIGERIRGLRKAKGLTQEKLAELADLHPTSVSGIETGKANYTVATILSISKALGARPAELLDFQTKKEVTQDFEYRSAKISGLLQQKDIRTQEKIFRVLEILLS